MYHYTVISVLVMYMMSCICDVCDVTYPQLQMSTVGPYLSSPSKSSGGRYHNVITLLVYGRSLSSAWYNRAKPKSASFIWPLHNTKNYCVFLSIISNSVYFTYFRNSLTMRHTLCTVWHHQTVSIIQEEQLSLQTFPVITTITDKCHD